MNKRVLLGFALGGLIAAALSCNFVSPTCTTNLSCPLGSYCNLQYQQCFDIIPDAGDDAGQDAAPAGDT